MTLESQIKCTMIINNRGLFNMKLKLAKRELFNKPDQRKSIIYLLYN